MEKKTEREMKMRQKLSDGQKNDGQRKKGQQKKVIENNFGEWAGKLRNKIK